MFYRLSVCKPCICPSYFKVQPILNQPNDINQEHGLATLKMKSKDNLLSSFAIVVFKHTKCQIL